MLQGAIEPQPAALGACGRLTMLVGRNDRWNFDPTANLRRELERKGADVRELMFDGGHGLEGAPLGVVGEE